MSVNARASVDPRRSLAQVMEAVDQEGRNPMNQRVSIECKVREVRARGRSPRLRHTLAVVHPGSAT